MYQLLSVCVGPVVTESDREESDSPPSRHTVLQLKCLNSLQPETEPTGRTRLLCPSLNLLLLSLVAASRWNHCY